MRLLVALLIVLAGVAYAVPARPTLNASNDSATFRIATFNIHKGANRENHYDLRRTIEAIAALDADVVGIQEAMRNDPVLGCDDQPSRIAEGLRRITGRPWSHVYATSWIRDDRTCLEQQRGDDVMTEGVAFLSASRITVTEAWRLPESRVALMIRVAAMPDVPIVVTHLAASRRNQAHRISQVATLLSWVRQRRAGIVMGDLNARAEASELAPLFTRFKDAWVGAWEGGTLEGVLSGGTRTFGTARIDFVLYSPATPLTVASAAAVDSHVSDHRPVIATFRRRASLPY